MSISPFTDGRVTLRPFEPEDVPALAAYLNHPGLAGRRYVPWGFPEEAPLSRKQIEGIYQKWSEAEKGLRLAVLQAENDALIGHAEVDWEWDPHNPSLSVVIAPAWQRQGYGMHAFRLQLEYLFGYTPAHNVSCWIADWNEPARQFVARQGFRESAQMRRVGLRAGRYYDLVVADILRPEWEARKGAADAA